MKLGKPHFNSSLSVSKPMDRVGIDELIAGFQSRSLKNESKRQGLLMALNMIDLTTLEGKDTIGKIKQLCYKARNLHGGWPDLPTVAAVCVYPSMVKLAKRELHNSGIKVASVATAFPSGQMPSSVKLMDTKFALDQGADEIDMVIARGKFLEGEYHFVFDEIAAIKELCGNVRLKVILETGELETLENVRKAADIAMYAGADFIKTSTGKIQPAATMQVTYTMLTAIRDYYEQTGTMVGMKPSGGITTSKQALHYLIMVKEVLGEAWLTKEWFRFGASSLANDLLMQWMKMHIGAYASSDYVSMD